jgi:antitoxin HigA-1
MYDPPHPGEIIREDCMGPLGLSVTAAADRLEVSRTSLSELLNGHMGVSPEMAVRLEKQGWSSAEVWLALQADYDLWRVRAVQEKARAILASAWPHHGYYRGIAIKKPDRDMIFDPSWSSIVIETEDGQRLEAPLTESFWGNCPELRYRQVGRWLQANGLARRADGNPPRFHLRQIGKENRFRLTVVSR